MSSEEIIERVNLIESEINKGGDKLATCAKYNLQEKTYNKEMLIREALKEYLNSNESISFISKRFGLNKKTLAKRLKTLNLKPHKIKACWEEAFDDIDTEEKAYWLGFLYADGYVTSKDYKVGFSLKDTDKDCVIAFNDFLLHKGGCSIYRTTKFNSKEKGGYMCSTVILNKHLWEALVSKGVVPHKSLILKFPDESIFKSKKLIFDFIRGYCDGDGTLGVYKHSKSNPTLEESLMFVGTKPFLEGIQKYLGKGFLMHKSNCGEFTWRLSYSTQKANNAARLLYHNAKIYLFRKKKIYDEQYVPRNREKSVNPETGIPS